MKYRKVIIVLLINLIIINLLSNIYAQSTNSEAIMLHKEARPLTAVDSVGRSQEKHELGIRKLEEAIKLDPSYYDAYVSLSKAYQAYGIVYIGSQVGNLERQDMYLNKARRVAKKAMEIAPNRPEAYLQYWNSIEPETEESRQIMRKLFEIDPNNPEIMYPRGLDLIDEGRVKEGIVLVLNAADRLAGEGRASHAKERLAERLINSGFEKEAAEVSDLIKRDEKFYRGAGEISRGNIESGLNMVKEATNGDYAKLSLRQKGYFASVLEEKKLYKDAADIFELMDREKYKEKITELRGKAKNK
jgi:tetratricopeptide (TPR) repeat protein